MDFETLDSYFQKFSEKYIWIPSQIQMAVHFCYLLYICVEVSHLI